MHRFTSYLVHDFGRFPRTEEISSDTHILVDPYIRMEKSSKNKCT